MTAQIFAFIGTEGAVILARILGALVIGALIGLERTFHGRPAGFRTHALVCIASALLMLATVYQNQWMTQVAPEAIRTDPTRMAQGIMTGIGFLGAGVIFKEGFSIRGLTTAASVWITAAIGILIGIGFWVPALTGAFVTLAVLGVFRRIESRMPAEIFAHLELRFRRDAALTEDEVRRLIDGYGFSVANLSYRLVDEGRYFEYRMVIRSLAREGTQALAQHLLKVPELIEFRIAPGD
jgi:putative Mg2+ transporter-C (MgtC) family protein